MGICDLAGFARHLVSFRANQWKSPEELEKIQEKKLARIIGIAKNNVPYYRKSLAGASPGASLSGLPVLEKSAVAKKPESFVSRSAKNLRIHSTSGSSGMPLKIAIGDDLLHGFALRYHCLMESGFGPLDTLVNLLTLNLFQTFPQKFLYKFVNVSPFLDEPDILDRMRAVERGVYFGYPSTLALLSDLNLRSACPMKLKKIICASENFGGPLRALAEKSFGCKCGNYYGANECWGMAFECSRGSLHVNSDSAVIEIVDEEGQPAGEGKSGEVLVTSLWRTAMPFIRYRIGDIASYGKPCACGRGTPVLSSLDGRATSFILLPDGGKFLWAKIEMRLRGLAGILQFQGEQESLERLTLRLVPSIRQSDGAAREAAAIAARALPGMSVKVEWDGRLVKEKSGKVRDFIPLSGRAARQGVHEGGLP